VIAPNIMIENGAVISAVYFITNKTNVML